MAHLRLPLFFCDRVLLAALRKNVLTQRASTKIRPELFEDLRFVLFAKNLVGVHVALDCDAVLLDGRLSIALSLRRIFNPLLCCWDR